MRWLICIALLACTIADAALTERYVTQAAGGTGDGTEGDPWTFTQAVAAYAPGDRVNVKNDGTYVMAGDITLSTSATATAPIYFRAYSSTIGDDGIATFTSTNHSLIVTGEGVQLEGFFVNETSGNATKNFSIIGKSSGLYRCKAIISDSGAGGSLGAIAMSGDGTYVINCKIDITSLASAGYGIHTTSLVEVYGNTVLVGNSGAASTVIGIYMLVSGDEGTTARFNNIQGGHTNGSHIGIQIDQLSGGTAGGPCMDNNIYLCDVGINITDAPDIADSHTMKCINNVIYDVRYGIQNDDVGNTVKFFIANNAIKATSGAYDGFGDNDIKNAITLTANPWTDPGNGDFTPNNTAGGGALIRGKALPTSFVDFDESPTVDNYRDVGAVQHEDSGGGGAVIIIIED